jgi:hypothetical protein
MDLLIAISLTIKNGFYASFYFEIYLSYYVWINFYIILSYIIFIFIIRKLGSQNKFIVSLFDHFYNFSVFKKNNNYSLMSLD